MTGFLFSSPSTSWVIGVDRLRQETIVGTRTLHSSSPGFRLGVRKWPTSMTGPFKIFVGAGLASGDIEPNEFGSQDPVLVFVPVSPSICSSVMKVSPDQVTRWLVRGNLVRLAAGVYF